MQGNKGIEIPEQDIKWRVENGEIMGGWWLNIEVEARFLMNITPDDDYVVQKLCRQLDIFWYKITHVEIPKCSIIPLTACSVC